MDPASVALSEGLAPDEPGSYAALSKRHKVAPTTLWNRAHGRSSKQEMAKGQQYLNSSEEKALVKYVLRMSNNGYPVPVKYLRSLVYIPYQLVDCLRLFKGLFCTSIRPNVILSRLNKVYIDSGTIGRHSNGVIALF